MIPAILLLSLLSILCGVKLFQDMVCWNREKSGRIILKKQKGSLLILKVENSFDGRLVRRRQEEFPLTDKADKKSHGIGLANIKSTAEKYQGTMDFKVNGRVFILSVMMKNERREEDGFRSDR